MERLLSMVSLASDVRLRRSAQRWACTRRRCPSWSPRSPPEACSRGWQLPVRTGM